MIKKSLKKMITTLLFVVMLSQISVYANQVDTTVKVGFFPMNGFHEYDNKGQPIGYDVDYLSQIAKYTHWNYEYVRVKNWDEALALLSAGQIDLVGSAQFTSQRAELYDFASYSSGTTYGSLVALTGNDALVYEDYSAFGEITIGCVRTYIRQDDFLQYASKHGFTPHFIYYENTAAMREALHAKEIDAMIMSIMETAKDEKIIAKFSPSPFYYITRKGNDKLKTELDEGISQIQIDSPEFEQNLMNDYYPAGNEVPFTKQELEYIKSQSTITVGYIIGRSPISYIDSKTGEITGITKEILDHISKESGLKFEYIPIPSPTSPTTFLKEGKSDIVAGIVYSDNNLKDTDLRLTTPFLTGQMVMVGRKGEAFASGLPLKVAIPTGFQACIDNVKQYYPGFEMVFYDTTAQCLDAVKKHDVDIMIQNSYVVNESLQGPKYMDLSILPTNGWAENLCIATPADIDPLFLSICNKAIRKLPSETIDQCILRYTVAMPYQISLKDFVLQYRQPLIAITLLLLLCLGILWYAVKQKRKNLQIMKSNAKTLSNITNNINGGVIALIPDSGFTITYANNGFLHLIGYSREEYEQQEVNTGITYVHPEDIHALNESVNQKVQYGESVEVELRIRQKNKGYIPVLFRGTLSESEQGVSLFYCVVVDITAQKKMIDDLETEKERYKIIIEQSDAIIFDIDWESEQVVCSKKFEEKFGWETIFHFTQESFCQDLKVFPKDWPALKEMLNQIALGSKAFNSQMRIQTIDGNYIWCKVQMTRLSREGRPIKVIGKIVDIDAQIQEHDRLKSLSEQDQLTGLYNKEAFRITVEGYLQSDRTSNHTCAVLLVDLDNFKAVNDQLGHLAGDITLQKTAKILRSIFSDENMISRFGGDEFCIFLSAPLPSDLQEKAKQVCELLNITCGEEGEQQVKISASVGIFHCQDDTMSYDEIFKNADEALYKAKEKGKNQYVFYKDTI